MRITFVIASADMAGGCKVVGIYAKLLSEMGHETLVVAPRPPSMSLQKRLRNGARGESFRAYGPHHLELMGAPHRLLESHRPVVSGDVPDADVIVATWWETAEWVRDFPRSKGAKAYFLQHHEIHMPGQPHERVNATWRLPYHKIVISRWLRDLAREFGDDDVSLVPNSVDMAQFDAPAREKAAVPTIGTVYTPAHFKGCDVGFAAARMVADAVPGLRMVVFGSSRPVRDLPLPAFAEFTYRPPQDLIKTFYAECDVWLCGARAEGFHLPLLEAMACRCPGVATRSGGPADIVDDGVNGYLVEVEDAAALAGRTIDVLSSPPAEWRRMSDAAYRKARSYTWEDAARCFLAAAETAMDKGSARSAC